MITSADATLMEHVSIWIEFNNERISTIEMFLFNWTSEIWDEQHANDDERSEWTVAHQ